MYAVIEENIGFELIDFSVNIDSTPLDSADSTGSVGDFTLVANTSDNLGHSIYDLSLENLVDKEITVYDSDGWLNTPDGYLLGGIVSNVTENNGIGLTITGELALGALNVRNVQQKPFSGTLEDLIKTYLKGRLKSGTTVTVHPNIAGRPITVPGWHGELWHHIKMLCAAESVEFAYPSTGYAELRPVRRNEGRTLTSTDLTRDTEASDLAQYVEVQEYNNVWVTNQLFYPPGGWSDDVDVITVNSGETTEFDLELEGSVSSIVQPTMQTFVSRDEANRSVFTVVGDDGFPIEPAMWDDFGGKLEIKIGEDTRHLVLTVTAPEGINNDKGEPIQSYALALASGDTSPRYSTLRILGTGVWFSTDDPVKFPTGVEAAENNEFELGEEVGVTIDNPFLSTRAHVATAVYRAARKFQGYDSAISGSVMRLSDEESFTEDSGSRVFYDSRPYRVRSASYSPNGVQFNAEDDLTFGDIENAFAGKTWGEIEALHAGLTYKEILIKGIIA